jgi:hypothetical protein
VSVGVTYGTWIIAINITLAVEITRSVRYSWVLSIESICRGTAHTESIRVVLSHVVKHDINIYPGKIIRNLR